MSSRPAPTIALVAVHGVGDQIPGAAARGVTDLLLRLRGEQGGRYSSFAERAVRIPTAPARVNARSAPNVAPDLAWSIFAEQHPFLRTQLQYGGAAARDREEDSPDHQLMRAQLADYRSSGEPYDTIRLEGERLADPGEGTPREAQSRVHVYEVRWADLARSGSTVRRLGAELYRLCLHVPSLGRVAVDHARLEHPASSLWRAYGLTHTWAVRLLTVFVPALFAAMLASVVGAALLSAVDSGLDVDRLVLAAWLLAAGGLVYAAFRAHQRLRPGAFPVGLGVYALGAAPMAMIAAASRSEDEVLDGTMRVLEGEAVVAAVAWSGVYLLGALAGSLGLLACLRADGMVRDRARRAARTAAVTLAVSATAVLALTSVSWAAIVRAMADILPARSFAPMLPIFRADGQTYAAFLERVLEVSAGAGLAPLLISACLLATFAGLALLPSTITEVRPPRAGETFEQRATEPSAPARGEPVDTDALWAAWEHFRRQGDACQRLGERLTRTFGVLAAIGVLLYVAVFAIAPVESALHWLGVSEASGLVRASPAAAVLVAGGLLTTLAVALVALRGPLARLTLGFRPGLELALAVDDYMRALPRDATPRARIAERYVSLLRYLCQWRDDAGRPYDAIVLVAHSQGATITADLLRFIQREEDPELEPIRRPLANGLPGSAGRRLYLFTTGAPLRQVYSAWFPHLYGWVRGESGEGVARPLPTVPREPWMLLPRLEDGHRVSAPPIPDAAAPDPYALGITRWVNAYRSGDYVGRALWRSAIELCEWLYRPAPADAATRFVGDAPPVTYVSEDAHRSRRELCIGAGAHTHYWDWTARGVALELDLLVTDAAKTALRVAKDTAAPMEGMGS